MQNNMFGGGGGAMGGGGMGGGGGLPFGEDPSMNVRQADTA